MSNAIPPLISSSPPPLDLAMDSEEEDDDFHPPIVDYSYSCDDIGLPNDVLDIPEVDVNRNEADQKKGSKDHFDKRKSSEELNNELNVSLPNNPDNLVPNQSEIPNDICDSDVSKPTEVTVTEIDCTVDVIMTDFDSTSELDKEVEMTLNDISTANSCQHDIFVISEDVSTEIIEVELVSPIETIANDVELNDKPVSDKESSSEPIFESFSEDNTNSSQNETDIAQENSKSINDDEIDDDFGDFADFSNVTKLDTDETLPIQTTVSTKLQTQISTSSNVEDFEEDDDFGEFSSSVETAQITEESWPALQIDRNNVDVKSKDILSMMFPIENSDDEDFLPDKSDDGPVFKSIRILTETNALTYQWNKSKTQQSLLNVLNVDTRNILFGPGWNAGMPIFAANLSAAPLEPQKTQPPSTATTTSNNFNLESNCNMSAEAQFDWTNSDMTNALSASTQKETVQTLETPKSYDTESVNSLQFTEVTSEITEEKTNEPIEFDTFADFQSAKNTNSEAASGNLANPMFPLRETHINNNERNEFDLQSFSESTIKELVQSKVLEPIQNVVLEPVQNVVIDSSKSITPKETSEAEKNSDNDFTEFQASLPNLTLVESKQSTNRSIEYKLAIENPIEPELLQANKTLQPTVLLPTKPLNSSVAIAWPEPGITDDEIRKFEEYSYSKTDQNPSNTNPNPVKSDQKTLKSDLNPLKPHQNPLKIDQKPSKTVSKSDKPTAIDDEWSDFQDAAKTELPLSIASLGRIAQGQTRSLASSDVWTNQFQGRSKPRNEVFASAQVNSGGIMQPVKQHVQLVKPPALAPSRVGPSQNSGLRGNHGNIVHPTNNIITTPTPHNTTTTVTPPPNHAPPDDDWSDFVSHHKPPTNPHQPYHIPTTNHSTPSGILPAPNLRQEDWTIRGPQFNSWTHNTSYSSNTSMSNSVQFNGFNSFGNSAAILNSSRGSSYLQGRTVAKGAAASSGAVRRETVPSISAMPDLEFASSRFGVRSGQSGGQAKQTKK